MNPWAKGNRGAAVIVSAVSVSVVRYWVQRRKKNKKIAINGNQTAYSSGFLPFSIAPASATQSDRSRLTRGLQSRRACQHPSSANLARIPETVSGIGSSRAISRAICA